MNTTGWANKKVRIYGTLIVDSDFQIHTCIVKLDLNAKIQINPGVVFSSYFSKYFRCASTLWQGFIIMGGNNSFAFNEIEDAASAFSIQSAGASTLLLANKINRNAIGIDAQGIALQAIIAGNEFSVSSPLNNGDAKGTAGVRLIDCPSATIGLTQPVLGYRNVFSNMNEGVKLQGTTVSIGLSGFMNNIKGITANQSDVMVSGVDTEIRTNFLSNISDIVTTHSDLRVSYCLFDDWRTNSISSTMNNHLEQISISRNIFNLKRAPIEIAITKSAIVLDRPRFGSGSVYRAIIDFNSFNIFDFDNKVRRGVDIKGYFPTKDFMKVDSNLFNVATGGTADHPTLFLSVDVGSAGNYHITRNTFETKNKFETGSSRWGAYLTNGVVNLPTGNVFWNNNMHGVDENDDGACLLHAVDAGAWSICQNTTDRSYRGFHFMGTCGKSVFGLNKIGDHSIAPQGSAYLATGLLIQGNGGDNAYIGDQECGGNTWNPNDYMSTSAVTAALFGKGYEGPVLSTINKNNFIVPDLTNASEAPTDRIPAEDWFTPGECSHFGCIEVNIGFPDDRDEWIKTTYPQPNSSPGVQEWQDTRQLYTKLVQYPGMLAYPGYNSFKNNYNNSSIALFARFDSMLTLALAPQPLQYQVGEADSLIDEKSHQLSSIDNGISDLSAVSPATWNARGALLAEIAQQSQARAYMRQLIADNSESRLLLCEQYNATLPENSIFESNQKQLNALSIKLGMGQELNASDKLVLHNIAQQCIEDAGYTRGMAISMLPADEGGGYLREDPSTLPCTSSRMTSRSNFLHSLEAQISPNPASDRVLINFSQPFSGVLSVVDVSGKMVRQVEIPAFASFAEMQVSQLPAGFYTVFSQGENGMRTLLGKLTISH